MKIELLWFEDCPNHHAARQLLEDVLVKHGVSDVVESVEVPDLPTGERVRFPGSPTIRINGRDVDPSHEDTGDYAPRCRVYLTASGFKGVPERAWVEAALAGAMGRGSTRTAGTE